MLVDILSSDNYLYVNVGAVKILGLNNAIYCSELLRIIRKASRKKKIDEKGFFKVDRTYLKSRTSLTTQEQIDCENNLSKVKLIEISKNDLDTIRFDDEMYMAIVAQEDTRFLNEVVKKLKTTKSNADKTIKKERVITALKSNISIADKDIHDAVEKWIDVLVESKILITKETVAEFENTLVNYCKTDKQKTLRLVEIATSQGWKNCVWAINVYEQEQAVAKKSKMKRVSANNVASASDISDTVF